MTRFAALSTPASDDRPDLIYAQKVLSGEIVACELTKKAVERHLRDLERIGDEDFPYWFDPVKGMEPIIFAKVMCRHFQGYSAGEPVEFDLWQSFCLMNMFGWKKEGSDKRRFSEAIIYVARKGGKTTLGAIISLYATFYEGEPGAQGFYIATKEDQARLAFNIARMMVLRSSTLNGKLTVKAKEIFSGRGECYLQPLGQDSKTLDGLNAHFILVDELHAHESRDLYDVMDSSTVGRDQPLTVAISTAGASIETSLGRIKWHHAEAICTGQIQDEGTFGIIYTLDEGDDWRDPEVWPKANPGIGSSNTMEGLMRTYDRRSKEPGGPDEFRKKHCNQWLAAEAMAYSMEHWLASKPDPLPDEELALMDAYGGLDLARKNDFSCFALWIPAEKWENGPNAIRLWSWIPASQSEERARRARIPLFDWERQKRLIMTPGETTNFDMIRRHIGELQSRFNIHSISYDPAYADQLVAQLEGDGFEMIEVMQFPRMVTGATMEFGRQMAEGILDWNEDPVLTWMVGNCVFRPNVDDYAKIDKKLSIEKVDGVSATINAMTTWIRLRGEFFNSRYDDPEEPVLAFESDAIRQAVGR